MRLLLLILVTLFCAVFGGRTVKKFHIPRKHGINKIKATVDALRLYEALNGMGTNETILINTITGCTNEERQQIKKIYYEIYKKDLKYDLYSDTSGNFRTILLALISEPYEYIAEGINSALKDTMLSKPDYKTVIEFLCMRNKKDYIKINNAYRKLYGYSLQSDIDNRIKNDIKIFFKLMISEGISDITVPVNRTTEDWNRILDSPDMKCSLTNDSTLMEFFAKESFDEIHHLSILYKKKYGRRFQIQLEKWCTDKTILDVYETVLKCAIDTAEYFAEELHKTMVGFGTNNEKLIRIIVSHSETDLSNIIKKHNEMYSTSLAEFIDDETSGYYKKTLKKLIGKATTYGFKYK